MFGWGSDFDKPRVPRVSKKGHKIFKKSSVAKQPEFGYILDAKNISQAILLVTFLGWLSDPFKG